MSLVDIVILVVLGLFLLKGVLRGLLKEVCSLLGLVLGGVLAFVFDWRVGLLVALMGGYNLVTLKIPAKAKPWLRRINNLLVALASHLAWNVSVPTMRT